MFWNVDINIFILSTLGLLRARGHFIFIFLIISNNIRFCCSWYWLLLLITLKIHISSHFIIMNNLFILIIFNLLRLLLKSVNLALDNIFFNPFSLRKFCCNFFQFENHLRRWLYFMKFRRNYRFEDALIQMLCVFHFIRPRRLFIKRRSEFYVV